MVLLVVFMSAASIMIGNLLQEYLLGDASESDRLWIWQHYGTAYRSFYTLYELTFAGAWAVGARLCWLILGLNLRPLCWK